MPRCAKCSSGRESRATACARAHAAIDPSMLTYRMAVTLSCAVRGVTSAAMWLPWNGVNLFASWIMISCTTCPIGASLAAAEHHQWHGA